MESGQTKWLVFPTGIRLAHALGVEPRDFAFGDSDGTEFAPSALPIPPSRMERIERALASVQQRLAALQRKVK